MADIFSKRKRSEVMSRIRGRGNRTTELCLIAIFRTYRFRGWRRGAELPGKPDFVFPKLKTAVFVDGCFWHGCPKHYHEPMGNRSFWRKKIASNKSRDRKVCRLLRAKGWLVLRIWEHELSPRNEKRLAVRLVRHLVQAAGKG